MLRFASFILSVLLLCGYPIISRAQYLSFFGDTSTSWNIYWSNLDAEAYDSFYVQKDTIVNGNVYKKIQDTYHGTVGLIREDRLAGKVWFKGCRYGLDPANDTTEFLMFDYSLNVGDTFHLDYAGPWGHYAVKNPISVDSMYYDGTGRKSLRFNSVNPVFNEKLAFIEGVGSNFGIIYYWYDHLEGDNYLLCARKDDTTDYVNKRSGSCGIRLAVPEELNSTVKCQVYPNPFENMFDISFNRQQTLSKVAIYTLEGKKVFDCIYKNATDISIKIKLSPGIYFLSIESDSVIDTRKIVAH